MTKTPISLQDLRRRIYVKAKAEPSWRFWGLFVHVCKWETLRAAYEMARQNNGAPGSDGVTFEAIEAGGVDVFLGQIRDELISGQYRPMRNRKKEIPKDGGKVGGVLSPVLSNLYLNEVDRMLERAREATREKVRTHVQYARYADDLVVLMDPTRGYAWLEGAVVRRLREELGKLGVEVNEEKSRVVDLTKGEVFGFLGFDFRQIPTKSGKRRPRYVPKLKKRAALLRKLKEEFRRHVSQPVDRVIRVINPILRGWVAYFRVGNSSRSFNYVRNWVEQKVRRHLMRNSKRKGLGWKRWSSQWLYTTLGLHSDYRVVYYGHPAKALPARAVP